MNNVKVLTQNFYLDGSNSSFLCLPYGVSRNFKHFCRPLESILGKDP